MATKITRGIIESYLNCKYKGHLKLAEQLGVRSGYEVLLAESREEVRRQAIDKILARHPGEEVGRDVSLTPAALKRGAAFLLNATLEDEHAALTFDGLKRLPGASMLGDFHYVPMLFFEGRQVRKQQRALLDVYGVLLSRLQGRAPGSGIIWHGRECRATRVRLNPDPRKAERLLEDLREMRRAGAPPRLVLNDHCALCEFRQRCHQQATQEDNISLLSGMKEKEVKAYARRGMFTLTQLSHTFRPRRKAKRARQRKNHRYHALQAMAIRDKRVYVFGTPELPDRPVKIYLDIEGLPDEGFVYLIGMIVVQGDVEARFSFWADSKEQEREIFERFLAAVSRYDDFQVFCYGNYERTFLKRMRKATERAELVDRVLAALVNVLSLVYAHLYFPCYSNGLKDVAACLGCRWTEPEASGVQSIVWRARWEVTHDEVWKATLSTYNMEDCTALKRLTEFVRGACFRTDTVARPAPGEATIPPVVRVGDIDKLNETHHWGKTQFAHPDFTFVNKLSHFDYQRERVYARVSRKIRKKRPRKHRNRKLPVTQYLEMTSETCPRCGHGDPLLIPTDNRTKKLYTRRSFDLVFTPGKIRRS
jgi:predicted RecB family nuclease